MITLKVVLCSVIKYNLVELRGMNSYTHTSGLMLIYTPAFFSLCHNAHYIPSRFSDSCYQIKTL